MITVVDFAPPDAAETRFHAWLSSLGLTPDDVQRGEVRIDRNAGGDVRYRAHLNLRQRSKQTED